MNMLINVVSVHFDNSICVLFITFNELLLNLSNHFRLISKSMLGFFVLFLQLLLFVVKQKTLNVASWRNKMILLGSGRGQWRLEKEMDCSDFKLIEKYIV